MTDKEKLTLIMRYCIDRDYYIHNEYIQQYNSFIIHHDTKPNNTLQLYKAKIRYEAFREFTSHIESILFDRESKSP